MTHWSASYVGLPWREKGRDRDGIDCYGLVRLVYREKLGRRLPSYSECYASAEERAEIAELLAAGASALPWKAISTAGERAYDVALFRRGRFESHVGIVIDRGRMLHVERGGLSCIESYSHGRWRHRLKGIYRYADVDSSQI